MKTTSGDSVCVLRDPGTQRILLAIEPKGSSAATVVELRPWEWDRIRASGETEAKATKRKRKKGTP